MVSRKDDTVGAAYGNPTSGFERLRSLIDEQRGEFLTLKQTIGRTHQGAGDDTRLTEKARH